MSDRSEQTRGFDLWARVAQANCVWCRSVLHSTAFLLLLDFLSSLRHKVIFTAGQKVTIPSVFLETLSVATPIAFIVSSKAF